MTFAARGFARGCLVAAVMLGALGTPADAQVVPAGTSPDSDAAAIDVTPWVRALTDADPRQAERAARYLKLHPDASLAPLLELSRDESWEARARAIERLASIPAGRARIVESLDDPSWAVRAAAANALALVGERDDFEALSRALADPVWAVRHAAVSALATLNDPRIESALLGVAFQDPDRDVAERALELSLHLGASVSLKPLEAFLARAADRTETLGSIFARSDDDTNRFVESLRSSEDPELAVVALAYALRRESGGVTLDSADLDRLAEAAIERTVVPPYSTLARDALLNAGRPNLDALVAILEREPSDEAEALVDIAYRIAGPEADDWLATRLASSRLDGYAEELLDLLAGLPEDRAPAVAAAWLDRLPQAEARRRAVAIVATRGDSGQIELLRRYTSDSSAAVRRSAYEGLVRIGSPSDQVDVMLKILADPSSSNRTRGAELLASLQREISLELLLEIATSDPEARVRRQALANLPRLFTPPASDALASVLVGRLDEETELPVRPALAIAIAATGTPDALDAAFEIASDSEEPWVVRRAVYDRFGRLRPDSYFDRLAERLDDAERNEERRLVLGVLEKYGGPRACELLETKIDDVSLRNDALRGLARVGCKDSIDTMTALALDPEGDPDTRRLAVESLVPFDDAAIDSLLIELALRTTASGNLRATAVHAIADRRYANATEPLRELLSRDVDLEEPLRAAVVTTLCRLGRESGIRAAIDSELSRLLERADRDPESPSGTRLVHALRFPRQELAVRILATALDQALESGSIHRLPAETFHDMGTAALDFRRPALAALLFEWAVRVGSGDRTEYLATLRLARLREDADDLRGAATAYRRAWRLWIVRGYREDRARTAPFRGLIPAIRTGAMASILEGVAAARDGNDDSARASLREGLRIGSGEREVQLAVAQYLIDLGKHLDLALEAARRADRISPGNSRIKLTLAEAWHLNGQSGDGARLYLDLALTAEATRDEVAEHLYRAATLFVVDGDVARGRDALARAIALAPSMSERAEADPGLAPLRRDEDEDPPR